MYPGRGVTFTKWAQKPPEFNTASNNVDLLGVFSQLFLRPFQIISQIKVIAECVINKRNLFRQYLFALGGMRYV